MTSCFLKKNFLDMTLVCVRNRERFESEKGHAQHKQSPRIIDITAIKVVMRLGKRQQSQPNQK